MKQGLQRRRGCAHCEEYLTIAAMVLILLVAFAVANAGHMLVAALLFIGAATNLPAIAVRAWIQANRVRAKAQAQWIRARRLRREGLSGPTELRTARAGTWAIGAPTDGCRGVERQR